MKKLLKYKTPLLIVLGLGAAILADLLNSLSISFIGGLLFALGLCFMFRTVNPDVPPPPPPPENPAGQ